MSYKPVMLMILDGWGIRTKEYGNAVVLGHTPNYDRWNRDLERALIGASEEAVGLVPDQMGNSEVGHLNLGAGRVVYQFISRINNAIRDGSFFNLSSLLSPIQWIKSQEKKMHIIGLLGPGGVHAHNSHLYALLQLTRQHDISPVLHLITDGRDTPPNSALGFLHELQDVIQKESLDGVFGTVSGRYYAMDRDKRWERTTLAYEAMVTRKGEHAPSAEAAIEQSYAQAVTDEFILPTVIDSSSNTAIEDGDVLLFYNFRADRMRQIVRLFSQEPFEGRPKVKGLKDLQILTFTEYSNDLKNTVVLFPQEIVQNPLAQVISEAGKTQFHAAETEKYPHVTYFFNGRREEPFAGEDREMVPSPKVATYDLQPEMSAYPLTELMLERLNNHNDDFLLVNFANPDMVGHTGSLEAAIKAVETVDECAGRLVEAVLAKGGAAIITADHGNCERMIDEGTGEAHTYHTTSLVPLFVVAQDRQFMLRPYGILADVAPTVLELMGLKKAPEMTGRSLLTETL